MSWHASLHAVGFTLAFLSVIPACFVFVRRYVGREHGHWAIYGAASSLVVPALIVLGSSNLIIGGVLFFIAGVWPQQTKLQESRLLTGSLADDICEPDEPHC